MNSSQTANTIYNIEHIEDFNCNLPSNSPEPQKGKFLYKSSVLTDEEAEEIINNESRCHDLCECDSNNIIIGELYRFRGVAMLSQIYNAGAWLVQVKASINGLKISGKTSTENWVSASLLNNMLDIGFVSGEIFFKALDKNKNVLTVQFLVVKEIKNMISAFVFGSNVADLILRGILHPDMQLSNFGTRENSEYPGFLDGFFICLDFAEAQKFNIPDDLDDNMIRRLTRSLFPIFQDLKTFSNISYFRAGFVSKCGHLGRELFSNACNSGFSSFAFLNDINNDSMTFSYNPLLQPEIIREWVDFNVDDVSPLKYRSLIEYQRSPERHKISLRNMYYLDNLFFMRSYMVLSELKDETSIMILILNMAMSSLSFNLPVTAYGLFKKCLYLDPQMSEVRQACKDGVKRAMSSGKITNVTDTIISRYLDNDLFGFIWILDDLDRLIPKDEKDLEGML